MLVYDELKHLVAKAKIESSSMESTLLNMYESGFRQLREARQRKLAFDATSTRSH